ncbi:MAG: methyltransferase domain-containing protein [Oligoflexales bacterium]
MISAESNTSILGCPACLSALQPSAKIYNASSKRANDDLFSQLQIQHCSKCDYYFTTPHIDPKKLDNYYKNTYRSRGNFASIQLNDISLKSKYGIRAISQLMLGKQFLKLNGNAKHINFLDIGSGPGMAILAADKLFNNVHTHAWEPDAHSHSSLESMGCSLYAFPLNMENFEKIEKRFDFILMSHVLEHFQPDELSQFLLGIKSILNKDGILLIEVPYQHDEVLSSNRNLIPHLSFFSENSLRRLLHSNFEIKFLSYGGNFSTAIPKKTNPIPKKRRDHKLRKIFVDQIKKLPLSNALLKIRRKLMEPAFHEMLKHEYFSYGNTGAMIRAVVKIKTEQ